MQKSDIQAFWIPEMLRNDLEGKFMNIQDKSHFWKFCNETLGDFLFTENTMINSVGEVDLTYINAFNTTTFTRNSHGRIFVGPMRFL